MTDHISGSVLCAVCGASCEGKPHAKDAKGRVICRACIDRKRAEKTAAGGADVMSTLLAGSKMASATPCPGCRSYMPADSIVCSHCGFNRETGKSLHTRVVAESKKGRFGLKKRGG